MWWGGELSLRCVEVLSPLTLPAKWVRGGSLFVVIVVFTLISWDGWVMLPLVCDVGSFTPRTSVYYSMSVSYTHLTLPTKRIV